MATALTQGLIGSPGYQAVRGRVLGQLDPQAPAAPAAAAPLPTAPFAPTTAAPLQGALSNRLNPQVGSRRTFPNGRIGQWDGTGWLHVG